VIVPVEEQETPTPASSTDTGGEQIIEPIEGSTVVADPQN
jgi:hypothetical protein